MVAINIRGTSGAGKSHLVRRIAALYENNKIENFAAGRKQPECTLYFRTGGKTLLVPGHYNSPCGGCDTIRTPDRVYEIVREGASAGVDVLYEGIMIMDDVRRAVELSKTTRLVVVALTTPVEECLAAVQGRRDERGDVRPLDPKNTVSRAARCERGLARLEEGGVEVRRLDRERAFSEVCDLLGMRP